MKRAIIITILIFILKTSIAPPVPEYIKEQRKLYAIAEIERRAYEKEFDEWKKAMAFKESSDNWMAYNSIGCIGSYQFCIATLEGLGFHGITVEKFKRDPSIFSQELQDEALMALIRANELSLKRFDDYIGTTVKGVLITRSGLIAAAHLGGVGGVERFLTSSGNPADMNGTSVKDYMQDFSQFNI
jgi:hypothetical protein